MSKWLYTHANLDKYESQKINLVACAADRLYNKLNSLDLSTLDISDYNKKYFGNYLKTLQATLQRYSYLLLLSINNYPGNLKDFVFLDYGAGSGILSLLAKEIGIGRVIYNDIYDVSCKDARTIAESIKDRADLYILGNIDNVIVTLQKKSLTCDAIASYDVIEHIYNVDYFMQCIPKILNLQGKIVMETTANPINPLINWQRMQAQKQCEYRDRVAAYGHKKIDTLQSYFTSRKEIIIRYNKNLNPTEIELLAKKTRGLIKKDILIAIDKYLATKELPQELTHSTNTCDPYTGNWAEHLIIPQYWQEMLGNLRLNTTILGGYYSLERQGIKEIAKRILNLLISLFQQKNIALSSSYIIYATKQ